MMTHPFAGRVSTLACFGPSVRPLSGADWSGHHTSDKGSSNWVTARPLFVARTFMGYEMSGSTQHSVRSSEMVVKLASGRWRGVLRSSADPLPVRHSGVLGIPPSPRT